MTGALVPPDDITALTAAIESLIENPALRMQYGAAGEAKVRTRFGHQAAIGTLAALLGLDSAEAGDAAGADEAA